MNAAFWWIVVGVACIVTVQWVALRLVGSGYRRDAGTLNVLRNYNPDEEAAVQRARAWAGETK